MMTSFVGFMLLLALVLVGVHWAFPPAEKAHSAATFVLIVALAATLFAGKM